MRILFVEDHELFARTVVAQFMSAHTVTHCASIHAAMDRVHQAKSDGVTYDAMLVDFDLPDGKGDDLVRSLRGDGYRGTIVAVSAHDEGNRRLVAAGANAVCRKSEFHRIDDFLTATS